MKYVQLIHQGDAPPVTPPASGRVFRRGSRRRVYEAYRAINKTPGVSPGLQLQPPRRPPPSGCRTARC